MKRFLCLFLIFAILLPSVFALADSNADKYVSRFFKINTPKGYSMFEFYDEICFTKDIGTDNTVIVVSEVDLRQANMTFVKN